MPRRSPWLTTGPITPTHSPESPRWQRLRPRPSQSHTLSSSSSSSSPSPFRRTTHRTSNFPTAPHTPCKRKRDEHTPESSPSPRSQQETSSVSPFRSARTPTSTIRTSPFTPRETTRDHHQVAINSPLGIGSNSPSMEPAEPLRSPPGESYTFSLSISEDDDDDVNVCEEKYRRPTKRKNFCPFCERLITNFSRHLMARHRDEDEVKGYMALSTESQQKRKTRRAEITNRLRNRGNSIFNKQVVDGLRNDDLLPVKRSSCRSRTKSTTTTTTTPRPVTNTTHVTCKHCLGFLKKESFYKHLAKCNKQNSSSSGSSSSRSPLLADKQKKKTTTVLLDNAALLLKENPSANKLLREEVFPKMQLDAETVVAQSDALISKYGAHFRFTHRGPKQAYYCSSRMRSLARLFITMKEIKPDIEDFRQCIEPKNFKILAESVRRMSGFDLADGSMKSPSVPPRLCSSLKRCANIVMSDAIQHESLLRGGKTEVTCEMNDFLHLMEKEWAMEVGSNSEKSRKKSRVMKDDLLPHPDDIRTFSEYIHKLCPVYVEALKRMPTTDYYERLVKLVIAHIITLNRRRPNETVEITLEAYQTTLNKRTEYGNDTQNVLTEEEIRSGEKLSIFYIPASKNLKKVPILLTKTFHGAVDTIIEARDKIGITSKYLFGRLGGRELFDGSNVLKEFTRKANLRDPAAFTANALRHHAATSSQLHTRDDTYTKRLSQFLGHDLSTHENFYEMPLPLVQKTKVGHRLLQMILPKSHTTTEATASHTVTSGALLSSGEETAVVEVSRNSPTDEQEAPPSRSGVVAHSHVAAVPDTVYGGQESSRLSTITTATTSTTTKKASRPQPVTGDLGIQRLQIRHTTQQMADNADDDDDDDGPSWTSPTPSTITTSTTTTGGGGGVVRSEGDDDEDLVGPETPPKKKHKRKRWSDVEKNTLYEKFAHNFVLNLLPPRKEIRRVWEEEAALKDRSLQQVVTYVNNIITKKQKILTPTRNKIKRMVAKGNSKLSP